MDTVPLDVESLLQDVGQGRKYSSHTMALMLLDFLRETPQSHGYQLIRRFAQISQNSYVPSAGAIYPALSHCHQQGWVQLEQEGRRKLYSLTQAGKAYLEQEREAVDFALRSLDYRGRKMLWMRSMLSAQGDMQQAQEQTGWLPEFVFIRQALKTAMFDQASADQDRQRQIVVILQQAINQINALNKE